MRTKRVIPLIMVLLLLIYPVSCGQRKESPPPQQKGQQGEQDGNKGYIIYINLDTPKKLVMYSVDTSGKNKQKVYEKNPYDASGYESKIAFLSKEDEKQNLQVINGDGSGLMPVMTDTAIDTNSISWAPDGRKLTFTSKPSPDRTSQVYYVEVGKFKTPVRITDDDYTNTSPKFSNDMSIIVFSKDLGQNYDIYRYDMGSRKSVNLSNNTPNDMSPVITPDGMEILFLSDEAEKGKFNLYMMNIDGGERSALTTGLNIEKNSIRISPDSSMAAFVTSDEKGNKAIHVIDMHKSTVMVTNGGYMAAWSGDSKKLYYAASESQERRIVEYDILGGTIKDVLSIPFKPGEESAGIKYINFTNKLK